MQVLLCYPDLVTIKQRDLRCEATCQINKNITLEKIADKYENVQTCRSLATCPQDKSPMVDVGGRIAPYILVYRPCS